MKRLLLIFVMAAIAAVSMNALADATTDVLYLNNGTVLKGTVASVVENVKVTFVTTDGKVYTYPMVEVRKIETMSSGEVSPSAEVTGYQDYRSRELRFFFAAEVQGAYELTHPSAVGFATDLNVVAGCRINEYFRVGLGVGARYYVNGSNYRSHRLKDWACPIFANFRGNIISEEYRDAVPFYSLDIGGTIGDNGFMIRPSLGYRFGVSHSAFLLAASYWGQVSDGRYLSFVGIKLGYEF